MQPACQPSGTGTGKTFLRLWYVVRFRAVGEMQRKVGSAMSRSSNSSPMGAYPSNGMMATGCALLKHNLPETSIYASASEKVIECKDAYAMHTDAFHFSSRVFVDNDDFGLTSYSTMISPLVKKTCLGHNTIVVIGGPASLRCEDYLLSTMQTRGLLSQAASQMLNSISVGSASSKGKSEGSVTLSWYKIGCDTDETVTDVLKEASATSAAAAGGAGGGADKTKDAQELHVRELDTGRGTSVPGLWEVELAASTDVDAVMSHVQRICDAADHSGGAAHSVVQLAITSERTKQATKGIMNGNDLAGMGKITFLLLSNLDSNLVPMWAGGATAPVLTRHKWVDSLGQLLQWIESKHATAALHRDSVPPYQKSRICLMLKDAVRCHQDSAVIVLLQPTEESLPLCHQWLQLADSLRTAHSYCLAASKSASSDMLGTATAGGRHRSPSPYRGPPADTTTANFRSTTPSAGNFDYTHPERRTGGTPSVSFNATGAAGGTSSVAGTGTATGAPVSQRTPGSSVAARSSGASPAPHSLLPATAQRTTRSGGSGSGNGNGSSSTPTLKTGAALNSSRYQSPSPAARGTGDNAHARAHTHGYAASSGAGNSIVEDSSGNSAVDRLREEVASLTQALSIKGEQLLQSQLAYDVLIKELHEDGSTLKAKDRERYKQVLTELKDYEIYRDVMETALSRMQGEVEALHAENKQQKQRLQQNETASRKREEFHVQYSKDLTNTRKKLAEAYERAATDEAAYKRVAKDKEELRVLQVALKGDRQRLVKDAETQAQTIQDLKKRLVLVEAKEAQAQHEVEAQRRAQEKLMDRLMTFQEENELLKGALTEMLEQAAQQPPPPPPAAASVSPRRAPSPSLAATTATATTTNPVSASDRRGAGGGGGGTVFSLFPQVTADAEAVHASSSSSSSSASSGNFTAAAAATSAAASKDDSGSASANLQSRIQDRRALFHTAPAALETNSSSAESKDSAAAAEEAMKPTQTQTAAMSAYSRRAALLKGA